MKAHVKESKTVKKEDVLTEINGSSGTVYALYTDKLTCGDQVTDPSHLLEVRIFDEYSEKKLSRYSVTDDFICRVIDDKYFEEQLAEISDSFLKCFKNRVLEDTQYLDVVSTRSSGRKYRSTGGGEYTLPDEGYEKILIRNYLDYDDNGLAYISDFRIVRLLKEGEAIG